MGMFAAIVSGALLGGMAIASAVAADDVVELSASGKDSQFQGAPSCQIDFVTTNRSSLPLTLFTGGVQPLHASSGKRLRTVELPLVGTARLPLPAGERGAAWPLHVQGASCAEVRITFKKFRCHLYGKACGSVVVSQKQLAGIETPKL